MQKNSKSIQFSVPAGDVRELPLPTGPTLPNLSILLIVTFPETVNYYNFTTGNEQKRNVYFTCRYFSHHDWSKKWSWLCHAGLVSWERWCAGLRKRERDDCVIVESTTGIDDSDIEHARRSEPIRLLTVGTGKIIGMVPEYGWRWGKNRMSCLPNHLDHTIVTWFEVMA